MEIACLALCWQTFPPGPKLTNVPPPLLESGGLKDLRVFILEQFVFGLIDLPCAVAGLLAALHPWRTHDILFVSSTLVGSIEPVLNESSDRHRWNPVIREMTAYWVSFFFAALVDWLAFVVGFLSLLCPSRTAALLQEVRRILLENPSVIEVKTTKV